MSPDEKIPTGENLQTFPIGDGARVVEFKTAPFGIDSEIPTVEEIAKKAKE